MKNDLIQERAIKNFNGMKPLTLSQANEMSKKNYPKSNSVYFGPKFVGTTHSFNPANVIHGHKVSYKKQYLTIPKELQFRKINTAPFSFNA